MTESAREGYLSSMLVYGTAMRRVDAVAVPVDSLHQPVVPGPSDRVQPRRKATLREKQCTLKVIRSRRGQQGHSGGGHMRSSLHF